MGPIDLVIVVIVVALVVVAARRVLGSWTGRRDCCSGDLKGSSRTFRAVRITDTDEGNYPYRAEFSIAGMTCENCARNVTNALNSIEGSWATVDLAGRSARILSKRPIDESAYRDVVSEAGYRLLT